MHDTTYSLLAFFILINIWLTLLLRKLLLNHHHCQLVTWLDDDEDLVKLENLKQVLSIVLKLSIKKMSINSHFLLYLVWQIYQLFIYIYL